MSEIISQLVIVFLQVFMLAFGIVVLVTFVAHLYVLFCGDLIERHEKKRDKTGS